MNKELIAIFEYLEREKGIEREIVVQAIEESLQAAARKNISGAYNVTVSINPKTGDIQVYSEKEIVEEVEVPSQEISLEDARELDDDCEIGQFIDVVVTPKDFGRIAAQKARQIIIRKLRNAERDVIFEEYRHRVGELISGTVKRLVRGANLIVDLGKVEAILPMRNYPKSERYQVGDKVLSLILAVNDAENGGAEVVLTRSHPEFVKKLMEQEVPEINDNTVIVDKIVREAGYRTKMTVRSEDPKVDPVGACVGMRGMRVKNVVRELRNEKIDIIPYSADSVELLEHAMEPIEIYKIVVDKDEKRMIVVVKDEDFASAIGKRWMNARLNGLLVGYELDVQRLTDYHRSTALQRTELASVEDPSLDEPLTNADGILNQFIFENLVAEGYNTPRAILLAGPEALAKLPGISLDTAEKFIEQIRKQRM